MFMSMVAEQGMFIGAGKGLFSVGRLSFSENSGRYENRYSRKREYIDLFNVILEERWGTRVGKRGTFKKRCGGKRQYDKSIYCS